MTEIFIRWGAIEADFARFYGIYNPLELDWRRFMVYLNNLPFDKSGFFAPLYNAVLNDEEYSPPSSVDSSPNPPKGWWKKELDRRRGRNRPRDTISLNQFMKEVR